MRIVPAFMSVMLVLIGSAAFEEVQAQPVEDCIECQTDPNWPSQHFHGGWVEPGQEIWAYAGGHTSGVYPNTCEIHPSCNPEQESLDRLALQMDGMVSEGAGRAISALVNKVAFDLDVEVEYTDNGITLSSACKTTGHLLSVTVPLDPWSSRRTPTTVGAQP